MDGPSFFGPPRIHELPGQPSFQWSPQPPSQEDLPPKSTRGEPSRPSGHGLTYNAHPGTQNTSSPQNRLHRHQRFPPRARNTGSPGFLPRRSYAPQAANWSHYRSILMALRLVPRLASTWDIWKALTPFGKIVYVEIDEDRHGERTGFAKVRFEPPPKVNFWTNSRCEIEVGGSKVWLVVEALTPTENEGAVQSPLRNPVPAKVVVKPSKLSFGLLVQPTTFVQMKSIGSLGLEDDFSLTADFRRRRLLIHFPLRFHDPQHPEYGSFECQYRLDIKFGNLARFYRIDNEGGRKGIVIALDSPPQFWRKKVDFERTHSAGNLTWGENDLWARAVEIIHNPDMSKTIAASLDNNHQLIDIGRWTTYWLELDENAARDWSVIEASIGDWNIKTKVDSSFSLMPGSRTQLWSLLEGPQSQGAPAATATYLLTHSPHFSLPFDVRYQLEVCISHDILHEHNISAEFLSRLANLANSTPSDRDKARLILEYVADKGKRIFDPMSLFEDQCALTFCPTTVNIPHYCALVRKVTVTPTRIYFSSPTVETTNRVIRHFDQQQDNFLRVQFTDELRDGRINGSDAQRDNEIYTRVFRVLNNGIRMGRWHWQFLAFGNSQIRENGAFFFCQPEGNTEDVVTCQKIRDWMGKFGHIKVVAKYAARLGQCFSTTRLFRGIPAPKVVRVPDVYHHSYCFTDGVGKISPVLAQMIAGDWEINPAPSAYQFRMGGCKGVLVTWPEATGLEVHIRKSQEKFHSEFNGLEIIRCSQFSVATLNRQTITILSSLGVPDEVFVDMLTQQLRNYDKAMASPTTAVRLLNQYVDENQMTLSLAQMILNGFMEASDPFTMTLLHLWRSWSIKALKERARIVVEEGAFVLGCVDETGTLNGYTKTVRRSTEKKAKHLPQIFLQVPDPKDRGIYKVITGLCAVGRNPSLHPGDIRVAEAVDVPALRHLRDVVVFPLHGDRDIPSMCSGGDLDGDDFFVIWDQNLLPKEWFNTPLKFNAPPAKELDRDPTVQDLKTFFALYMKNNSLPLIAHAHLAQADYMDSGPKDARCVRLAELHSQAVDYVKTGVEAEMDKRLAPRRWPHFMEKRGRASYRSSKVLGQLYDKVDKVDFRPSYNMPFDQRILTKYKLSNEIMKKARRIKSQYDAALRRVMGQLEIKTEFETWTAFVLSRPRVGTQYKFHETVRRESEALKQQYRDICIKEAGGSRDPEDLGPFAAAMYQVTWEEVQIALYESRTDHVRPDGTIGRRPVKSYSMPLISFPWLFDVMLGRIATGSDAQRGLRKLKVDASTTKSKPRPAVNSFPGADPQSMVVDMDYARTSDGQVIHRGEILRLFHHDDEDGDYGGEISSDSLSSIDLRSPDFHSTVDNRLDPESVAQTSQEAPNPVTGEAKPQVIEPSDSIRPHSHHADSHCLLTSNSPQSKAATCPFHAAGLGGGLVYQVPNVDGEISSSCAAAMMTLGERYKGVMSTDLIDHNLGKPVAKYGAAAPSDHAPDNLSLLHVAKPAVSLKAQGSTSGQDQEGKDLIDLSDPSPTNLSTTDGEEVHTGMPSISDESPNEQYTSTTGQNDRRMECNSDGLRVSGKKVVARNPPDPFIHKPGTVSLHGSRPRSQFNEDIHTIAQNPGIPIHELSLPSLTNKVPPLPASSSTAVRLARRPASPSPCAVRGTQTQANDLAMSRADQRKQGSTAEWDWTELSPRSKNWRQNQMVLVPVPVPADAKLRDADVRQPGNRAQVPQPTQATKYKEADQSIASSASLTMRPIASKALEGDWTAFISPWAKAMMSKEQKQPHVKIPLSSGSQDASKANASQEAQTTILAEEDEQEPEFEEATLDIPELSALERAAVMAGG